MSSYLQAADQIARRICRDAVWHGDQCAWLGDYAAGNSIEHRSLGPDLYAGAAGIGLFLAELHRLNADRVVARVAAAGANYALACLEQPRWQRPGYYLGSAGIAHALVRIGENLGDAQLVERGLASARTQFRTSAESQHDVLSGSAGAAVALLRLAQRDPMLLRAAWDHAERLLAVEHVPLTGFSHGGAGIAWALAEVFAATGDDRCKEQALRLIAQENQHYDHQHANWLDLRTGWRDEVEGPRFALAWCNGAPGIALARWRTHQLLADADCARDAARAANKTRQVLRAALEGGSMTDLSLCHGYTGLADILWTIDPTAYNAIVHELAQAGISAFAEECSWPSGVGGGDNPGLLLGLAGTGYFYLRLHDPSVATVLI